MDQHIQKHKFCPTCGKPMEHKETIEKPMDDDKPFQRFEIWNCLNCSEEWQIEITRNILRKNAIIEK